MLALPDLLHPPPTRAPLTLANVISYIFPVIVCYFATAFLVLQPRTQLIRVALWPITAILTYRGATSLDLQGVRSNMTLAGIMCFIATRTFDWAIQTKPLIRHYPDPRPVDHRSPTFVVPKRKRKLVLDAVDLLFNFRGCGWDWSQGLRVPPETLPTSSRIAFVASSLVSGTIHAFIATMLRTAVWSFSPNTIGSKHGGTIFDDSLPPHIRYLRSSIISILYAFELYTTALTISQLTAVVGILVFQQNPDQWPPLIDVPWRATSLQDFWGRRWHQTLRRIFIFIGRRPLSLLLGRRVGGVMGVFLASGFYHHVAMLPITRSTEMWRLVLPFGMMGVGVVFERAIAGRNVKVGGWKGWVWTMCWVLLWGNVMVDAWVRTGMCEKSGFYDGFSNWYVNLLVTRLVRMFDDYLHAYYAYAS